MSLKCSSAEWKSEATWDLPSISLWGLTSVGIVSEHFLRPSRAAGEARELLPAWYWAGPVGAWGGPCPRGLHPGREHAQPASTRPRGEARLAQKGKIMGQSWPGGESKPGVISLLKVRSKYGFTIVIAVLLLLVLEIHIEQCCEHWRLNMNEANSSLMRLTFQRGGQIPFPLINRRWLQNVVISLKRKTKGQRENNGDGVG